MLPTPTPSFEMETGSGSRSALPRHGVGVAARQGAKPNATRPGTAVTSLRCRHHWPSAQCLHSRASGLESLGSMDIWGLCRQNQVPPHYGQDPKILRRWHKLVLPG